MASIRAALTIALCLFVGCDREDACDDLAFITIIDPTSPATLTYSADDTNDGVDNLQIVVIADVCGLAVGHHVDLQVDGSVQATAAVPSTGPIVWTDVTTPTGTHTAVAVTREGGLRSNEVTLIVVDDVCFAVTVVSPVATDDRVTLTAADDVDGEACGATFEAEVTASTTAPDGSEARVFVNGTPQRVTTVTSGEVRFDAIPFDNRGGTPNSLRVEITDPTGLTCSGELGAQVFVECS